MINFCCYDEDGKITELGGCSEKVFEHLKKVNSDKNYLEGHYTPLSQYIVKGKARKRRENRTTISKQQISLGESVTLSKLPRNSTIILSNTRIKVGKKKVYKLTPTFKGVMEIIISRFPSKDVSFYVEII